MPIRDTGCPAIRSHLIDSDGYYAATNIEELAKEVYEALTTNSPSWALSVGSLVANGDITAANFVTAGNVDGVDVSTFKTAYDSHVAAGDIHVAHSGVTITAGTGLSGGGTIAASRTIDCTITQYTDALVEAVIDAEIVGGQSIDNAIDALINTHDVADNHIAHSGVTITAGTGLSGGGTIAADRTINCDITQYSDELAQVACVSNAVFQLAWNGVDDVAASKNALYDKITGMDTLIAANTTEAEVGTVISAALEDGHIIDEAIDAVILIHKNVMNAHHIKYTDAAARIACISDVAYGAGWDGIAANAPSKNAVYDQLVTHYANANAHHALVTVAGAPLTLSTQLVTFNYDANYFRLNGNDLQVGTDAPAADEVLTWTGAAAVWSAPTGGEPHDLDSHSDVTMTGAQLEALLMFGVANHGFVPCFPIHANDVNYNWLTWTAANIDDVDTYWYYFCAQPQKLGTLKLYLDGWEIGIQDADAGDYITAVDVYANTETGLTLINNDPTNRQGRGDFTHTFAPVDVSGKEQVIIRFSTVVTTAGQLEISFFKLRCYYAA